MKTFRALAFAGMAGLLAVAATPARASTIDFQGPPTGSADGDAVYSLDLFAGFFGFDVRDSMGNGGGQVDSVLYRDTADYSNSSALYSPDESQWFEMNFTPKPGKLITSVTFSFGGNPNQDRTTHYAIFGNSFSLLSENAAFLIDGTSGSLVTLSGLHLGTVHLQFTGEGVGLRSFSFEQTAVTPLPGALLLFGTALAGLGVVARKKRAAST